MPLFHNRKNADSLSMTKLIFCVFFGMFSGSLFAQETATADEAYLARLRQNIRQASNPYDVLGVSKNASTEEIKKAHKALVKQFFMQANQGDKAATEAMAKLNAAQNYLTKPEIDGRSRGVWSYNDGSTSSSSSAYRSSSSSSSSQANGGMSEAWKRYYEKMSAARGPGEREALRTVQLQHVRTADDFRRIVSAGAKPNDPNWNAEVRDFVTKNMDAFMETRPNHGDLNSLARMLSQGQGTQRAIYDSALRSAKTPADMIRLIRPDLSGQSLGGTGWIKDINAAFSANAYRFYTMKPTPQEIQQFEAVTRVSFQNSGRILSDAKARAQYVVTTGKPAETYKPGVMSATKGIFGKMMGRFLAVDPTIVSGVLRATVEDSEAKSLSAGVCPPGIQGTPKVLTESYIQLYVMLDLAEQQAVLKDCEFKSTAAKKYLEEARLRKLEENREKLAYNKDSLKCEARKISYRNDKGQNVEIRFDAKGEFKEIEIAPQAPKVSSRMINRPWVGNVNHRILFKAGETSNAFEYSAFNYPKDKRVDKPAKAFDSETAFFLRLACLKESCDEAAFASATGGRDDSFYSINPGEEITTPTSNKPFGKMDTDFLETAGADMHRLLGLLRSTANQMPQAEKFCASLKDHVKVVEPMAALPSEEGSPSEEEGVE